ncbi:MAG TPA: LamG-like jellyroll fold domain-containing protein [Chitinophagaceae bacterium]|nr:LamG-like jellyroll fold domain-containing protein [Chitinophagaceae bacterium]
MYTSYKYRGWLLSVAITGVVLLSSCSKDNPNNLPSVSPADFAGKIQGFDSSEQVASDHLVAYWSFDGTKDEILSGTAPTSSVNDTYIDKGVRGKALALDSGYVYYAKQIPALGASLHSFTILAWIQILNNGSTPTQLFQLARPGNETGDINFLLSTDAYPSSNTDTLIVNSNYFDGKGTQNNLNANWNPDGPNTFRTPKIGADTWTQVGITYDSSSNTIQIWGDGQRIGTTSYQNRGTNYYSPTVPNEVIIGGWYNNIPGSMITPSPSKKDMVGSVDEIRIYNEALGAADILALYELGEAGQ